MGWLVWDERRKEEVLDLGVESVQFLGMTSNGDRCAILRAGGRLRVKLKGRDVVPMTFGLLSALQYRRLRGGRQRQYGSTQVVIF